uniref:NADH-ubiquinone oxidoreductase chain 3 n=1 Tax=Eucinetus haemorrhoidalis TaxID=1490181 RepID=A0A343A4B1_9COLE|nr:NADH dehydrogenase subunit 3 [Eucinetus haemorrhoidalis]AOY39389.1 NADH dehydrogenase subunit 3 [Eucinetus haemorrhoidalis]
MKLMISISMVIFFLTLIMMLMCNLISKKTFIDREKSSPFECGFDPYMSTRLPFSLHFFLIALIFLIFDVEITLLLPIIFIMKFTNLMNFSMISFLFLFLLLIGLFHEWKQGALNWTI